MMIAWCLIACSVLQGEACTGSQGRKGVGVGVNTGVMGWWWGVREMMGGA